MTNCNPDLLGVNIGYNRGKSLGYHFTGICHKSFTDGGTGYIYIYMQWGSESSSFTAMVENLSSGPALGLQLMQVKLARL